jgi:hypothetical protein
MFVYNEHGIHFKIDPSFLAAGRRRFSHCLHFVCSTTLLEYSYTYIYTIFICAVLNPIIFEINHPSDSFGKCKKQTNKQTRNGERKK